jgi:hypothetical protein
MSQILAIMQEYFDYNFSHFLPRCLTLENIYLNANNEIVIFPQ